MTRFGRRLSYSVVILCGGASCVLAFAVPTTKGLIKHAFFHCEVSNAKAEKYAIVKIRPKFKVHDFQIYHLESYL